MFHDRDLGRAARQAPASPGLLDRIRRLFGAATEPAPPPEPLPEDEGPGLEQLACTLAELIGAAQIKVDGAASLVGKSADEAQAYRATLAQEADTLDRAALDGAAALSLIELTRAMIDRTRLAEERLRAAGEEFALLQGELGEARIAAERDPLTGLPNRRALEGALARAVIAARAADDALSLAFCDIDDFKQINDKHGHALGDRVIRLVADTLADQAGDGVFVGRQSGEEFIMMFEGMTAEQAAIRVDGIRARLAGRTLRSRTTDQPVGQISFSAGVASLEGMEAGYDLLARADRALYRAKNNGKNRVEIDRG